MLNPAKDCKLCVQCQTNFLKQEQAKPAPDLSVDKVDQEKLMKQKIEEEKEAYMEK